MTAALESSDKVTERARTGVLLTICICVVLSMSTWFSTAAVVPLTVQLGRSFALTFVTIWLARIIADCVGWQWVFLCLVPGPIVGVIAMMIFAPRIRRATQGQFSESVYLPAELFNLTHRSG
jgi:hypothetical protein